MVQGYSGVGKSTLAAYCGLALAGSHTVRWLCAEDGQKLQSGYEELAHELRVVTRPRA